MATLKPVTGAGLNSKNKNAINANFKALNEEIAEGSGGSSLLSTTTVVTSAQLLTLVAAPVTLVPAPGVGKTMRISSVRWDMVYKGVVYDVNNNLKVSFANNLQIIQTTVPGSSLLQKKDDCFIITGLSQGTPLEENQPLVLHPFGGGPTLGNSDITVTVNYEVVEIGYVSAAIDRIDFNNATSLAWQPAPSFPPDQLYFVASLYPALLGGTRAGSSFAFRSDGKAQNNAGVFSGATAVVVTSRNGGSISPPLITSNGYLSFTYMTPPVTGYDYIDVVCVDGYGRAVSKSLLIDVAYDS